MDVSIKIRENGDISWLKNMYEKFKNKNSFNKDNIGLLNEKENNNSYCQEHCKGYQETRRCFADGECQAKKNAELSWSEEDEIIRNALLNLVEMYYGCCFNKGEKNRLLDWLKSLKDRVQPQWKPNEEQLKALNTMSVTGCITEVGQGKSLVELYEQLKKLREE